MIFITDSMKAKARREDIEDLVNSFLEKHPLAKELGSEYVTQSDKATVDALALVCDICDLYVE